MQKLAFIVWFYFFISPLVAQEIPPGDAKPLGPKTIVVEITPRAIEGPILKYRFLPREDELKPGNAVPILLRLPWEQRNWMEKVYPNLQNWEDVTLTDPKWKEYSDIPPRFFDEMKRAAYRRDAGWEYPIGEVPAMTILLPDVQGLRAFLGYGLSSRAKYHLSRSELEEALEVIKVGIANSRHIAGTPFVVNQLVAAAIQRTMFDRTLDLISQPKSPNLYWGLSAIPKGILSLERTADIEGQMLSLTFPFIKDLDKTRDSREWKKLFDQQLNQMAITMGLVVPKEEAGKKQAFAEAERVARRELVKMPGYSQEKVAQMTMEEAVLRWYVFNHLNLDARYNAYSVLPPREAIPQLVKLNKDANEFYSHLNYKFFDFFKNPLFNYLSLNGIYRKIQMIRVIEAVRHYAATHDGMFPDKLEDITDIPVPLDPLTDKAFVWKVKGGQATLSPPDLPAEIMASMKEHKKDSLAELLGTTYQLKLRTK